LQERPSSVTAWADCGPQCLPLRRRAEHAWLQHLHKLVFLARPPWFTARTWRVSTRARNGFEPYSAPLTRLGRRSAELVGRL
jgi:hypothetical protein